LVGKYPFEGKSKRETLNQILESEINFDNKKFRKLSPEAKKLIN
jgi:hypothetical protein